MVMQYREAELKPASYDNEARTVDLVWTTGAAVQRYDWRTGDAYLEVLRVDEASVRLERMNAGAPLLDSHRSYGVANIIGAVVPGTARVEGGLGLCTVRLSEDPAHEGIVANVAAGVIRNVSVGYATHAEEIRRIEGGAETRTATEWEPYEVSLVPIPADAGASTRGKAAQERDMSTQFAPASAPAPQDNTAAVESARQAAIAAERERVAEINTTARMTGLVGDPLVEALVRDGASVDAARKAILERKFKDEEAAGIRVASVPGGDASEKFAERAAAALFLRAMPGGERDAAKREALERQAYELRGQSMTDIARASLEARGVSTRGKTRLEIGAMVFRSGVPMTTSDFPNILGTTVNRIVGTMYQGAERTHTQWTHPIEVEDFRTFKLVSLSGYGDLDETPEGAEYPAATLADKGESMAVKKRGKAARFTLEDMANDNLRLLTAQAAALGLAAARSEDALVYGLLAANAALADGVALFHSTHNNLGTAGAPTADSLGELRTKIRTQTGINGEKLSLQPRFVLVPEALAFKVEQLLAANYVPTSAASGLPPSLRAMTYIPTPHLETGYYMTCGGLESPVAFARLVGESGPVVDSENDITRDVMLFRVRNSVGAGITDHRGIAKNAG